MPELELCLLTSAHATGVRSLLLSSFFLHEPLNERLGYNLPDEVEDLNDILINKAVKDQCSFVYLDGPRLVGFILNFVKSKDKPDNFLVVRSLTVQ